MKLFRKKLRKQDEKVLAEASDLALRKLKQYFADRRNLPPVTTDAPKKSALTRLRWWWMEVQSLFSPIESHSSKPAMGGPARHRFHPA